MATLDPTLRRQLEKSVLEARTQAESGARAALQQLAADQSEPFSHMSPDERDLRVKLRARGRQIGDTRTRTGQQTINHLTVECAYEHWHRMLFSWFLAENHLLVHPDGVPVTLEKCDKLAPESRENAEQELLYAFSLL